MDDNNPQQQQQTMSVIKEASALTCAQVDASPDGTCVTNTDRSDEGFRDCNVGATNCVFAPNLINRPASSVNVQNNLGPDEEAKINLDLKQLLNCDGESACKFNSKNTATQTVRAIDPVGTPNSILDFDFDAHMTQINDNEGQDHAKNDNTGRQTFDIEAAGSSTIDADSKGKDVVFVMDQENRECDDVTCKNDATQTYDLDSSGSSTIDVSSTIDEVNGESINGFDVNQLNDGCDIRDGASGVVKCTNTATQLLKIDTANSAVVTWDSQNHDDTIYQENDCDFGDHDCTNTANVGVVGTTTTDQRRGIDASGTSQITMDDMVRDVDQFLDCDDQTTRDCSNTANIETDAQAIGDGVINAEGSQEVDQYSNCNDNAGCINTATLRVGLGEQISTAGVESLNAVDGELNADYRQHADQTNECERSANCQNIATINYFATAKDSATVNSISDQEIIQSNTCARTQNCVNTGTLSNNVFASGTSTLNGDTTQTLEQRCTTANSNNCLNTNTETTRGSAIGSSILTYQNTQNIFNPTGTTQPTVSASFSSSGTQNNAFFPATQPPPTTLVCTANGQTNCG